MKSKNWLTLALISAFAPPPPMRTKPKDEKLAAEKRKKMDAKLARRAKRAGY